MRPSLTGTPVEERNVRHVFKRVLEKGRLRHMRIHDLRHTYRNTPTPGTPRSLYVAPNSGHRDVSITLRVYAHYLPSAQPLREVDRLDMQQPSAIPAQPNRFLRICRTGVSSCTERSDPDWSASVGTR